ncbi:hypothetical protein [Bacteroides congonensis]|uniref:hypothetical protein n=2 Tax=Bacteroides congonensis TaxID=1871006 RepID=UPI00255AF18E|nr:hypothetical protein [Bacteroides congonensis]
MHMKKNIRIKVTGRESSENVRAYDDLIRCEICVSGRTCAFWTTEANYKALVFDGLFKEAENVSESEVVICETGLFVEV